MAADDGDRVAEAERLLARLTEWDPVRPADVKSTGESRARIARLEEALAVLGARYARRAGSFRLVEWAAPGEGRRLPDE
jgi:hypothetical protein